MSDEGWFSLHRSVFKHWTKPVKPYSKFEAWVDLIGKANHAPAKFMIKGQLVSLERGQQARSMVTLASEWGWSRDKVKRFCDALVSDGMISLQTSQLTSVITLCNYSNYQKNTATDKAAHKSTNKQQTGSKQVTNNNVNNVNNKNKGAAAPLPEDLCLQSWDKWIAHRKALKLKKYSTNQIAEKIAKLPKDKQAECINYSIDNNYQGLFPERYSNENTKANEHQYIDKSAAGQVRAAVARRQQEREQQSH